MGYIYSGSNTTSPIGKVMDYNNTNPSRGVAVYRLLSSEGQVASSHFFKSKPVGSFASAIYGDGPYSLLRPNASSDIVAQNIDLLA